MPELVVRLAIVVSPPRPLLRLTRYHQRQLWHLVPNLHPATVAGHLRQCKGGDQNVNIRSKGKEINGNCDPLVETLRPVHSAFADPASALLP
jgi:hypothetical protein